MACHAGCGTCGARLSASAKRAHLWWDMVGPTVRHQTFRLCYYYDSSTTKCRPLQLEGLRGKVCRFWRFAAIYILQVSKRDSVGTLQFSVPNHYTTCLCRTVTCRNKWRRTKIYRVGQNSKNVTRLRVDVAIPLLDEGVFESGVLRPRLLEEVRTSEVAYVKVPENISS